MHYIESKFDSKSRIDLMRHQKIPSLIVLETFSYFSYFLNIFIYITIRNQSMCALSNVFCSWSRLYCLLSYSFLPELTRLHETLQQHRWDRVNVGKSMFIHNILNLNIQKKGNFVVYFFLTGLTEKCNGLLSIISIFRVTYETSMGMHSWFLYIPNSSAPRLSSTQRYILLYSHWTHNIFYTFDSHYFRSVVLSLFDFKALFCMRQYSKALQPDLMKKINYFTR